MRFFGGVQRLSSSSSGMVDLYGWIKVNISTELWEAVWAFKSVQFVAGPEPEDAPQSVAKSQIVCRGRIGMG